MGPSFENTMNNNMNNSPKNATLGQMKGGGGVQQGPHFNSADNSLTDCMNAKCADANGGDCWEGGKGKCPPRAAPSTTVDSIESIERNGEELKEGEEEPQQRKLYKADENPPLALTFLFGLQVPPPFWIIFHQPFLPASNGLCLCSRFNPLSDIRRDLPWP
jgi:hypothetical protein